MADLIDRAVAIDAVHKSILDFFDICDDDEESPMTYKDERLLEFNKAITTQIKAVPSAQPNLQQTCNKVATDCISRQAALNTVQNMYDRCDTGSMQDYHDLLMEAFEILPSAVEVVRCKECKHFAGEGMYCAQDIIVQYDHFYCYYGEQKDG